MKVSTFLKSNPTRKQVADILCKSANMYVLSINDLWCWKELSEKFNLTIDDFYDHQEDLSDHARNVIGVYNWKTKIKE